MERKRILLMGKVFMYLSLPPMFFFLPWSLIEGMPLCLFKGLLGVECPGCGMTRAVYHAVHGNIPVALSFNRAVLVVLPIVAFAWARGGLRALKGLRAWTREDTQDGEGPPSPA